MDNTPIVVLDNGECTIKAGIAGEDHPSSVVPTCLGYDHLTNLSDKETFEEFLEAHAKGDLHLRYPIRNGSVQNWEDMEALWQHVVDNHIQVETEEANILITEPIANPRPSREKMAEILLEKLNFKAISIATSPVLPFYATGRRTGIVLNVGEGTTQVVPVYEGYPITEAMQRVDVGGRYVTQIFKEELVNRKNVHATSTLPFEVFRLIKEKTCYVTQDHDRAFGSNTDSETKQFELPDGEKIEVGKEAYQCPEFLFSPTESDTAEKNHVGLHQLLYRSIMKTDIDVRKDLYANIILSGGSTLFPGFSERLEREVKALVPPSVKVKVVAHPARKYFTWIGGSVMASLKTFENNLVSKRSWEEGSGRNALAKLCT